MAQRSKAPAKIRELLLISIACITPVALIELGAQYMNRHDLRQKAWAIPSSAIGTSKLPSTHLPWLDQTELSPWVDSTHNSYIKTPVRFRTDDYGTIHPSSLKNALTEERPYVLFCGGSTTEGWASPEGGRIPDHFSRATEMAAVNASKSGKDLANCIFTIKALLESVKAPPARIFIANSVNTLMRFGLNKRALSAEQSKSIAPSEAGITSLSGAESKSFDLNQLLQTGAPGLYQLALGIKMANGPYAPMEYGVAQGCCFLSSEFNQYSPEMDWENPELQTAYQKYVSQLVTTLEETLIENNYPLANVTAFIEPNSFGLPKTIGQKDYRQRLHSLKGHRLGLRESKEIVDLYDSIYASAFEQKGIDVLWAPEDQLSGDYFYDAIHTTAKGSEYFGALYADHFNRSANKQL